MKFVLVKAQSKDQNEKDIALLRSSSTTPDGSSKKYLP